jgi:uncharacterized delta-60 repeat protein
MPNIFHTRTSTRAFALALCALFTTIASQAYAVAGQAGSLDATWANTTSPTPGIVTTGSDGQDRALATVIQPDGKIVLAGFCDTDTDIQRFCAVRYLANGSLDTSFGSAGRAIYSAGTGTSAANAIAMQPDGKFILAVDCVVSNNRRGFCAARLLSNGTLDPAFGNQGVIAETIGTADSTPYSVALQANGKVVLAGQCLLGFCALRLEPNGTLDTSFGAGGVFLAPPDTNTSFALVMQPDDKFVIAGFCANKLCALRINNDGTPDNQFGNNGRVITVNSFQFTYVRLALQPDGKLVLTGTCTPASTTQGFCAVRYSRSGVLDTTFGLGGIAHTPVAGSFVVVNGGLALQPDGKLVLAGGCSTASGNSNTNFCAARYHDTGTLDTSFGTNGTVITNASVGRNYATALSLQPDGKLLLAGICNSQDTTDSLNDFCAVRYDGGPFGYKNCSLDIDGDNRVLATTDSLIHARVALGITGNAVVSGINFAPTATRNTWPLIRDYLITQCGMSLVQ